MYAVPFPGKTQVDGVWCRVHGVWCRVCALAGGSAREGPSRISARDGSRTPLIPEAPALAPSNTRGSAGQDSSLFATTTTTTTKNAPSDPLTIP